MPGPTSRSPPSRARIANSVSASCALGRDGALRHALDEVAPQGLERRLVLGLHERPDRLPGRLALGEQALGGAGRGHEALDERRAAGRERLVEHVADERDLALEPERARDVAGADQPAVAPRLEAGAEVPVQQRRVELAALELVGDERRRPVGGRRRGGEVDAGALARMRLEEEPVLVEGAARDADALAREVADLPDRRFRRHHHGALGRRVGDEPDLPPLVPQARREEKIGHDHVDLPAQERDRGRRRWSPAARGRAGSPPPRRARSGGSSRPPTRRFRTAARRPGRPAAPRREPGPGAEPPPLPPAAPGVVRSWRSVLPLAAPPLRGGLKGSGRRAGMQPAARRPVSWSFCLRRRRISGRRRGR